MPWSWKADGQTFAVAALVAGDSAAFMSGFCPSVFTVRTFRSSKVSPVEQDNTRGDIRRGMVLATALALIVAYGGAEVSSSYWPLAAGVGAMAVFWIVYEWSLAHPHDVRGTIADGNG
jgi:hypothetical protein